MVVVASTKTVLTRLGGSRNDHLVHRLARRAYSIQEIFVDVEVGDVGFVTLRGTDAADMADMAEANAPAVQSALRSRFRRNMGYSLAGIPPTTAAIVGVLWSKAGHTGLIIWAALALSSLAVHWQLWFRQSPDIDWSNRAIVAQAYAGVIWGLSPWLMLPHDPVWQALFTSLIVSLMAASIGFSSALRGAPGAFVIPIVLLSSVGYLVRADAELWGAVVLIGSSAVFSVGLSEISRASDVEAAVLYVRSHKQATVDSLTGALARREVLSRLDAVVAASSETVGVAYLDIDRFKQINDSLGHSAGDDLLVQVADRVMAALGGDELLGRMGGDELVVLSPGLRHEQALADLGHRILSCFETDFVLADRSVAVSCSVGLAGCSAQSTSEQLLAAADTAMYQAKRSESLGGVAVGLCQSTKPRDQLSESRYS